MHGVELHEGLRRELKEVSGDVIQRLSERVLLLKDKGWGLSPPYAKVLKVPRGTQPLANLRFNAGGGVWRVTYCLAERQREEFFLLLAVGDKRRIDSNSREVKNFYSELIQRSQKRLKAGSATVVWP